MSTTTFDRALDRLTRQALTTLGADVRRLREDAGITRRALSDAAGIDASFLGDIEAGTANPSVRIGMRLAMALGADLPLRLYPTTGPTIRDSHQSAIAEALLGALDARWQPYAEIAVRHPARGWIDLGMHDAHADVFVATEIQSELRRLEQLLRWAETKASSLPSWEGWERLEGGRSISRLLVVRETRTNRTIAEEHRRLIRVAYPADGRDALAALVGRAAWPGPAMLWASRARTGQGPFRLVARA